MSLRVAVVGCGAVAQRLYRAPLKQLERKHVIHVAALIDPVEGHSAALAMSFPRAARYTELDRALSSEKIDLTLVLSPAHLHCEQTITALRYRSSVLCEKPMATTEADCIRMNDAWRESSCVLAIGMIRRFIPAFAELRRIVVNGLLGKLKSFEYREGHKFEWDVTTPAAFKPRRDGGTGVLFDIGPHVIDSLAWILGDVRTLSYADDALAGIESNISMEIAAGGCAGLVNLSWDYPQLNELRVLGENAEAVVRVDRFDQIAVGRPGNYRSIEIEPRFPSDVSTTPQRAAPRSYPHAVYCQLIQVMRAILLNERPAVDGDAGRACVATLESALSMARPLAMPWLHFAEQSAFSRLHWTHA